MVAMTIYLDSPTIEAMTKRDWRRYNRDLLSSELAKKDWTGSLIVFSHIGAYFKIESLKLSTRSPH
jgi:hypothetical protein